MGFLIWKNWIFEMDFYVKKDGFYLFVLVIVIIYFKMGWIDLGWDKLWFIFSKLVFCFKSRDRESLVICYRKILCVLVFCDNWFE